MEKKNQNNKQNLPCNKIFNLSNGDTTVLEQAPATAPAKKALLGGIGIFNKNANGEELFEVQLNTAEGVEDILCGG